MHAMHYFLLLRLWFSVDYGLDCRKKFPFFFWILWHALHYKVCSVCNLEFFSVCQCVTLVVVCEQALHGKPYQKKNHLITTVIITATWTRVCWIETGSGKSNAICISDCHCECTKACGIGRKEVYFLMVVVDYQVLLWLMFMMIMMITV